MDEWSGGRAGVRAGVRGFRLVWGPWPLSPKKWFYAYSRRSTSIEPPFANIKDEAGESFRRGKVRVRGIIKTGLMGACALASKNRRLTLSYDRNRATQASGTRAVNH